MTKSHRSLIKYSRAWFSCFLRKTLNGVVTWLVSLIVSARGRRLMATASLYAHVRHMRPDTVDMDTLLVEIRELEELLSVTTPSDKALVLPIILHQHIWPALESFDDDTLSKRGMGRVCNHLIQSMPTWLQYDPKVMYDDFSLILLKILGPNVRNGTLLMR